MGEIEERENPLIIRVHLSTHIPPPSPTNRRKPRGDACWKRDITLFAPLVGLPVPSQVPTISHAILHVIRKT